MRPSSTGARYAVIDVGTNSVKLVVAARSEDGAWHTVVDRSEITRLGEGLTEQGEIMPAAAERTGEAISGMAAEARRLEVEDIAAVGTAGLRLAANRDAVVAEIHDRSGIAVEVISAADEARLAYRAVAATIEPGAGSLGVFETGGGSSQFTFGRGSVEHEQFSLPVGAARYTDRFRLDTSVSQGIVQQALRAIGADLAALDGHDHPDTLVGLGGAVTNMAAVSLSLAVYDPGVIRGSTLERAEVGRQLEMYRTASAEQRRSITGLQPQRAEVILAGACIVASIMDRLSRRFTATKRPSPR